MTEENATQNEEPEVVGEETDEPDVEAHQLREQVRDAVRDHEPGQVREQIRDE